MVLIKRILFWGIMLLVVLAASLFVMLNGEKVSVDLLFVKLANVHLAVVLIGVFVVGAIMGLLVGVVNLLKANADNQLMKMKIDRLERAQEKSVSKLPVDI